MSSQKETFHWVDYVIFSVTLALSCACGIYYAVTDAKKQSEDQFILGGRKLQWLPVTLSLVVSYTSAVSQLGIPTEVYLYGIQFLMSYLGLGLASLVSAYTFVPLLYNLKIKSCFEYLELRYQSKAVRCVGTLLSLVTDVIFIGIATYSPAIALEAVTGLPVWSSIICVVAVATFYTTLGGLKAVVWTDTLQSVVMVCGMVTIIISGIYKVGGVSRMWSINEVNDRLNWFNLSADPTVRMTFWSLLFGRFFAWFQIFSSSQASVQRFCAVPSLRKAKLTVLLSFPLKSFLDGLTFVVGLVLYSYFSDCDPLKHPDSDQQLSSSNQLIPLFVMNVIGWPGIPGLFLASLFSGSLSTVSSSLSSLVTITWEDMLRWKFNYLGDRCKTTILKGLVLFYGLCGAGFAFLVSTLQVSVLQISLSLIDAAASPLLGLFILGAFFTRSNWLGAIIGAIVGFALSMWISVGSYLVPGTPPLHTSTAGCEWNETMVSNVTTYFEINDLPPEPLEGVEHLYTVSFLLYPVIGTMTTIIVGMISSLLTGPCINSTSPDDINRAYLIFPLDNFSKRKTVYTVEDNAVKAAILRDTNL